MKKIIVVGTSHSLLKNKNGVFIDGFDCVYRSINSLYFLDNYKEYTGVKVDKVWSWRASLDKLAHASRYLDETCNTFYEEILFLNENFDEYEEVNALNNYLNEQPRQYYDRYMQLINNLYKKYNKTESDINISYFKQKSFLQCCIMVNGYKNINNRYFLAGTPTAGIRVLYYLTSVLNLTNICVTGFDFFNTPHFWRKEKKCYLSSGHKSSFEKIYYKKLLKENRIYEL